MRTEPWVALLFAGAVLPYFPGIESCVHAFTLERQEGVTNVGWGSTSLTFDYDDSQCPDDADQFTAEIDAAIAMWNAAPSTNLTLTRGQSMVNQFPFGDIGATHPIIICYTDPYELGGEPTAVDPLGATILTLAPGGPESNGVAGTIVSATVYINAVPGSSSNAFGTYSSYLPAIIAHEMGHAMGLGHSADTTALMYYTSESPNVGLGQDDLDGISWLYPREEPGQGKYFGCGTIERSGGRGAGGGPFDKGVGKSPRDDEASPSNSAAATEFWLLLAFAAAARLALRRSGRRIVAMVQ